MGAGRRAPEGAAGRGRDVGSARGMPSFTAIRTAVIAAVLAAVLAVAGASAASADGAANADGAASAAETGATGETAAERRFGPETNLPLPRFVSLKARANIRRGPGLTHRIDWVFTRRGMPLEVVAEHGHWRKVRDVDADSGWIHHALLRGARSAVVVAESAALRRAPETDAPMIALAEAGAIVAVEACAPTWCEVKGDGVSGWVRKAEIWGAREDEEFD